MSSARHGQIAPMQKYKILTDPVGEERRKALRQQTLRDLGRVNAGGPGAMRLALNLTDLEHEYLIANNPQLADDDSGEWLKFIRSSESDPFKVGTKV